MWKLCWCPLRVGWPCEVPVLVFLKDDIRVTNAFYVPGIMLSALYYLTSHLIFATTLWSHAPVCHTVDLVFTDGARALKTDAVSCSHIAPFFGTLVTSRSMLP